MHSQILQFFFHWYKNHCWILCSYIYDYQKYSLQGCNAVKLGESLTLWSIAPELS
jgi:hypothetical protein